MLAVDLQPDISQRQHDEAAREKAFAAERSGASVRLAVVVLNSIVYFAAVHRGKQMPALAEAIIGIALAYSLFVALAQPYRTFPVLLHSYFTAATDAILISVWLFATGGYDSPFYVLWYVSVVAVAFRYSYRRTMEAAVVYAIAYLALLAALGQLAPHLGDVVIRTAYIFFIAVLSGEVSREAFRQARSKVEMRDLNAELERRVAERTAELEAANRELEAFSYSVSHDLRAPLRSIDGFSQVLAEDYGDRLDGEGLSHLSRIRKASKRMAELMEDLLTLSRVSRADVRRQPVDLSDIVEGILAELARSDPARNVTTSVASGIVAEGDPNLLRVALQNLLENAWKFTSRHPNGRIEFGALWSEHGPRYYVRDDGAGFDMTHASKLFGPFQRLHPFTEFEGTGIGLATVQRIVHRHGGQVWAEGSVEGGALFTFTLGEASRQGAAVSATRQREVAPGG